MPYVVKILEDKEFDKLPYKHVKEALGCADPKTNTAYVRNTHWGEASKYINLLTIQHEIDELVAKTSPHEEDGIRYKKGGAARSILPTIIGTIIGTATGMPWLGAVAGGMSNVGMQQYAQSRHPEQLGQPGQVGSLLTQAATGAMSGYGGTVALTGGIRGGTAAGPGFFSKLEGISRGAVGMAPAGGGTLTGQTMTYGGKTYPVTTGGALTSTSAMPYGIYGNPTNVGSYAGIQSLLASGTQSINVGQSGFKTAGAAGAARGGTASKDILSMLDNPMTKMGLGSMALSALPISTSTPNLGDTVAKWLTSDTVTAAGKRAQEIAGTEYLGDFAPSKEIIAYTEIMEKDIRKQYKQRREDLDKMGINMSDQFMTSGERLEMQRRLGEEEQSEVDRMKAEWLAQAKQQHAQYQYNYVMQQLGADESIKRELLYADLADIMWKYNLAQEDIMNFRKLAADAGMYMFQQGTGMGVK